MFARGLLSFHPALSPVSGEFFLSPTIPAHPRYPGEGGYTGFLVRPIRRAVSTETQLSALFPFNRLRTLLFSVAHLSSVPSMLFALFPQKRGVPPLSGHTNPTRRHSPTHHARPFPLPPLPPFL